MIPFHVQLIAKLIAVLPHEGNESKGEIVQMHFKNSGKYAFNYQVVGCQEGYDWIWRHVAHDYWKVISKVKQGPWSCQ